MDSSFLMPKISAKFDRGRTLGLRGHQMQVHNVEIAHVTLTTGTLAHHFSWPTRVQNLKSSISRCEDITWGVKLQNGLPDPNHAPFTEGFSSAGW